MDFVEIEVLRQPEDVDRRRKDFGLNDSGSRDLKVSFCNVDIASEVEHTPKRLPERSRHRTREWVCSAAFLNSAKCH
jgi:hypothetical protein